MAEFLATYSLSCVDMEWEDMRQRYLTQMSGLHKVRLEVGKSLDRLRRETERLQQQEGFMREEEDRLKFTYEQLENKQAEYRIKGGPSSHFF